MTRANCIVSLCLVAAVGCGNKDGSAASTQAPTTSTSASTAASPPSASAASVEKESVDVLRTKATKVMEALKKGDAKGAAEYCLVVEKRESVAKSIQGELHDWPKRYQSWDGKFTEIKSGPVMTYVGVGEENHGGPVVVALAFLRRKGAWSLDDTTPTVLVQKADWDKYGSTVN